MSLGSRIREYRLKRGFTQAQMADRLGMTEANFSSYERGKSVPPSEKLSQIAKIFDVSTDYLLFGSDLRTDYLNQKVGALDNKIKNLPNYAEAIHLLMQIIPKFEGRWTHERIVDSGLDGAIIALKKFDSTKNTKFSTFTYMCIENNIIANARQEGIDLRNTFDGDYVIPPSLVEAMEHPEFGVFFKDFLDAPDERKKELVRFWNYMREAEKGRKPGDRQGE